KRRTHECTVDVIMDVVAEHPHFGFYPRRSPAQRSLRIEGCLGLQVGVSDGEFACSFMLSESEKLERHWVPVSAADVDGERQWFSDMVHTTCGAGYCGIIQCLPGDRVWIIHRMAEVNADFIVGLDVV